MNDFDLNSLTDEELRALENGARKLREQRARSAQKPKPPELQPASRQFTPSYSLIRYRDGQLVTSWVFDTLTEAFGGALKHGCPIMLADQSPEEEVKALSGSGLLLVEHVEIQEGAYGPTKKAIGRRLHENPPLSQYFAEDLSQPRRFERSFDFNEALEKPVVVRPAPPPLPLGVQILAKHGVPWTQAKYLVCDAIYRANILGEACTPQEALSVFRERFGGLIESVELRHCSPRKLGDMVVVPAYLPSPPIAANGWSHTQAGSRNCDY